MHLDPITGLWKEDDNDYKAKPVTELEEKYSKPEEAKKEPQIKGRCVLNIRFETPDEYLKWKYYMKGRQWDFNVSYPAIMRAEYEFNNSMDVEIMAKKIVSLLQMGFDVYSAAWRLEDNNNGNGKSEE